MIKKIEKIFPKDSNMKRLLVMLVSVFLVVACLKPQLFLTVNNFSSMAKQFPEYGLMAIGVSLAMITGGIDLAIVSTANLSAIIAAKFLITMVPADASSQYIILMLLIGVGVALLVGAIAGAFNGVLIAKVGIPAILATLGTQQLFTGIAIVLTEGKPVSGLPLIYSQIGNKNLGGYIPVSFIIYIIMALGIGFILSKTRFGKQMYMMGTNPKAAKYAGLNNTLITIKVYMLSGILGAMGGLIMMARSNSAKADYGASYTLQCVLIAVLGGVNPNGGFGKIGGVTIAIIILQMLSSGLNMFENVSNFYRDLIWGGVLIAVLIFNYIHHKNEEKQLLQLS